MFLFYSENVGSRATSNEEKAMDLLSYISGDAFDIYFSRFVSEGSISDDGKDNNVVKSAFIQPFIKMTHPEEAIFLAISTTLGNQGLLNLLKNVDELYKQAGFSEGAKFGLLRKIPLDDKDLSQFLMLQNPSDYDQLLKSVKKYA